MSFCQIHASGQADLNQYKTAPSCHLGAEMTKRNKKYQSTHEGDNRQTTSESSAKHPKIMSSSGECLLSLLAAGVLPVSKLIMASTPDRSHIPGGPGISTLDSGCDTHTVINDPPELNRSRSVMKRAR